jgi:hypothetical protein
VEWITIGFLVVAVTPGRPGAGNSQAMKAAWAEDAVAAAADRVPGRRADHRQTADPIALVGMQDWTDPTLPAIAAEWGLSVFSPDGYGPPARHCSTGSTTPAPRRWPSTFDVDTIDAEEIQLGLGADLGGLTLLRRAAW